MTTKNKRSDAARLKKYFRYWADLDRKSHAICKLKDECLNSVPRPFKEGDILRTRDAGGRVRYWKVWTVFPGADVSNRTIRFHVSGNRCTKAGEARGRNQYIDRDLIKTAEVIK